MKCIKEKIKEKAMLELQIVVMRPTFRLRSGSSQMALRVAMWSDPVRSFKCQFQFRAIS